MQPSAARSPGGADLCEYLPFRHVTARRHVDHAAVRINAHLATRMQDHRGIAEVRHRAVRVDHESVICSSDRRAFTSRPVHPSMGQMGVRLTARLKPADQYALRERVVHRPSTGDALNRIEPFRSYARAKQV